MNSKTDRVLTLLLVGIFGFAGYYIYQNYLRTQADKEMSRFQNALRVWEQKIIAATINVVPGWEGWYRPPGPERQKALQEVKQAALWQVNINQREIIPAGYEITEVGGENGISLGLLEKV